MAKGKDVQPATPGGSKQDSKNGDVELESLMSEIESGLREDEFKKLWDRYGIFAIGAAVMVVVSVFAMQLWRQHDVENRAALAARYDAAVAALESGRTEEAAQAFAEIATDKGEGYGTLARLNEATIKLQQNDVAGAVADYQALADDETADPVFRDLGTLLRVMHGLDRDDPKVLEAALQPLLAPENAFYYSALELQSLLAAKQGDNDRASQLASQLADDPQAPGGARQRAHDLAAFFKPATSVAAANPPAPMDAPPAETPEPAPANPEAK